MNNDRHEERDVTRREEEKVVVKPLFHDVLRRIRSYDDHVRELAERFPRDKGASAAE